METIGIEQCSDFASISEERRSFGRGWNLTAPIHPYFQFRPASDVEGVDYVAGMDT